MRLSPPAYPWLTQAPTSAVGDAATAETPPPDDPSPFAAQAPFPGEAPRRRDRRAVHWALAVLAACAFFIAGMAVDSFGSGDDGDARGVDPSTEATVAPIGAGSPGTSADASPPQVVYEVTASGSRNTGSVSYTDQDGDIIRRNGIPLPWRTTFPVGTQRKPLVLIAQRKGGGDAGPVTCTITVGGKLLAATTADGVYAAPQCSGSG